MGHRTMKIYIKENTYIYLVILLFLVPIPWLCAWLVAVCFHEFCHWISVRFFGGAVYSLTFGVTGANMVCETLTNGKQLVSVLSGPIGGFLLVLTAKWFPRIALCSWVLSGYNLLPLLPLDGGRALQILLKGHPCFYIIEKVILIAISLCAVYLAICLHFGVLPLAVMIILWLRNRKRPCKEGVCKVQ